MSGFDKQIFGADKQVSGPGLRLRSEKAKATFPGINLSHFWRHRGQAQRAARRNAPNALARAAIRWV